MSDAQSLHIIKYRGLPPVTIYKSNVWFYDRILPRNLVHHIMSLRWLKDVESKQVRYSIVEDFVSYHARKETKSKFYLGRAADHSASIRLKVMLEVAKEVSGDFRESDLPKLLESEIGKTLDSCLSGKTYKEAHNHGLMVDLVLIETLSKGVSEAYKKKILATVPERVLRQLNAIFSESGACKEHSISYQEYNLHVLHDLKRVLSKYQGFCLELDSLCEKVNSVYSTVKEESKKLLGHALVAGSYMPLGDSPSQPKGKILDKVYGDSDPEVALYPYSKINGFYFSKSAGFLLYRGPFFSLGFTASWHSKVHKQNDDLSIVVYDKDGSPIILDGGYSGVISDFDQRDACYHSTFMPVDWKWNARDISEGDFSGLNIKRHGDSLQVVGNHNRVLKHVLNRKLDVGLSSIKLIDSVHPVAKCRHRFIVPKDAKIKFQGETGCVFVRDFKIFPSNNEKLEVSPIEVIYEDALFSGLAVDFISEEDFYCDIIFLDEGIAES